MVEPQNVIRLNDSQISLIGQGQIFEIIQHINNICGKGLLRATHSPSGKRIRLLFPKKI